MEYSEIEKRLRAAGNPEARAGMARFGINAEHAWGIPVPALRKLARETGRDHRLAQQLWDSGQHESRLLAGMIADPKLFSLADMEAWTEGFNSWDVCDQCCMNLFRYNPLAYEAAAIWCRRREEFVKRAAFALMAALASGDKKAPDAAFISFLPLIEEQAEDERNFVKKAVNWALRQIGKRNAALNEAAIATAQRLAGRKSAAARWIAADTLRELAGDAVQARLKRTSR